MYPQPDYLSIVFVYGALMSIAAGSVSLNYRKNGVLNLGLPGLMFLGAMVSSLLVRAYEMSPYWGLLFGILVGGFGNLLLNKLYGGLRERDSFLLVTAVSLIAYLVLHGLSALVYNGVRSSTESYLVVPNLITHDFTMFNLPGVMIITAAWLIFQTITNYIIEPAVKTNESSKWNLLVYFLAGASATCAGVLFPIWFQAGSMIAMIFLMVVGVSLFSGLRGLREPVFGGIFLSWLMIWLTGIAQSTLGDWTGDYQFIIPCLYILISIPVFPNGIIGSILRKLRYKD